MTARCSGDSRGPRVSTVVVVVVTVYAIAAGESANESRERNNDARSHDRSSLLVMD